MITKFKITNITCGACVKLSTGALEDLPGVKRVIIGEDGSATIESDSEIPWEDIKNVLAEVDKKAILI